MQKNICLDHKKKEYISNDEQMLPCLCLRKYESLVLKEALALVQISKDSVWKPHIMKHMNMELQTQV